MKKLLFNLRALMLLLLMMVGVSSAWAEEATMAAGTNGSTATVNEKSAIKVGTSKAGGDMTITVPEGATSLEFYAAAWNGVNGLSLDITPTANVSPTSVSLTADTGISGNSPFTLSGTESSYKFTIALSNITAKTTLTLTSSAAKRFVVWGATYTTGGGDTPDPEPTKYDVTVADNIANGTVTATPTSATEGAKITLTATPANGFEFGSWNVTNASTSAAITVTDNKFTMPAANVNVSATFNAVQGGEGSAKTYNFADMTDFSSWGTSYEKKTTTFSDGAYVELASANKSTTTITNCPVTKGGEVIFKAPDGKSISSLTFTCTQWTTKAQTITLHTSSDRGNNYTATKNTSSTFVLSALDLSNVNAVKFSFSSSSNQVGIKSIEVAYIDDVVLSSGNITAENFTLNAVGDGSSKDLSTVFTDEANTGRDMTYSIVTGGDVVSLGDDGKTLTAVKAGTATVKAEQSANSTNSATEKTITVTVAKVDPEFSIEDQEIEEEDCGEVSFSTNSDGRNITFVSENENIATAEYNDNNTFYLYGWSAGETDITATIAATEKYNQKSVTFHVTVTSSSKEKYIVSFEMNGHGTQIEAKSGIISGSTILAPTDPSAEGYTFGGWYKEETCINAWNFSTDRVESNITLYAKWTINSYIVSFDLQGHGDAIEEMIVEHGEQIAAPTEPTATGYTFGGWYKEEACNNAWNFSTDVVESDIVLYAKWSAEQFAITWMVNGNPAADGEQSISVAYGSKVSVLPETPADLGNNKFMGWTAIENYSHESDAPSDLFTTVDGSPNITAATTFYAVYAIVTSGDPRSEEMTNSEIASLSSSAKLAYATAVGYKGTNIDYEFKAYTDNSRNWVQLKMDQGAYVKIVAPGNITKVVVCITSNTNGKGGIDDISKHNAYLGYVGLVTKDCSFTKDSENVGITNSITDNMASIESDGSSKEVFLKVSTGARIWSIETYYNDADICSNYTTSVKIKQTPMLSFDAPEVNKTSADEDFVCVATSNIDGLGISYSSSKNLVATVDTNTGLVHIVGKGTTTITATSEETEDYYSTTAQFTLNVAKGVFDGVFDFTDKDQDYGSGVTPTNNGSSYIEESKTWVAGNVTLVTDGKYRKWISNSGIDLRCYVETSLSFSVPSGYYITSIAFGTNVEKFETEVGNLSTSDWNGYANNVVFYWKEGQTENVAIEKITVSYGEYLPLAVSSARWATFAPSKNVELPTGAYDETVRVYHVSTNPDDEGMIDFAKTNETITEGKTIAAGTGILVKAEEGTYYFPVNTTVEPTELIGNQLVGVLSSTERPGGNAFIFKKGTNGIGFYPWSTGNLAAGKAYLQLSENQAAGEVRFVGLPDDDENTTGLEVISAKEEKGTYNLFGQKVNPHSYKGVIMRGGAKKIIK